MTRHLPSVARYLLGTIFFVFGLNAFLHFIPNPPPPERVMPFMTGMMSTGYFFPLLKGTEIACGALLLSNRFVPLALVVLSPIVVQIAAFHFLFEPSGAGMAAFLVLTQSYLGWAYRGYFRGVLTMKTEAAQGSAAPKSSRVPATAS